MHKPSKQCGTTAPSTNHQNHASSLAPKWSHLTTQWRDVGSSSVPIHVLFPSSNATPLRCAMGRLFGVLRLACGESMTTRRRHAFVIENITELDFPIFSTMATPATSTATATATAGATTSCAAAAPDGREARFLASQSARLLQAPSSSSGRLARGGGGGGSSPNDEEDDAAAAAAAAEEGGQATSSNNSVRNQFWDAFRHCRAVLSRELDAIASGSIALGGDDQGCGGDGSNRNGDGTTCSTTLPADGSADDCYATASARAVASSRLDAVLASLRLLERHCLSPSSSSVSPTGVAGNSNKNEDDDDDDDDDADKLLTSTCTCIELQLPTTVPDHLPPGDVRLLTTELGSLHHRLEGLREDICPPELFVFRRYRAAMAAGAGGRGGASGKGKDKGKESEAGDGAVASVATGIDHLAVSTNRPSGDQSDGKDAGEQEQQEQQLDMEQHYGSSIVRETNCTITITNAAIRCCSEDAVAAGADPGAATTFAPLDATDAGSSLLIKDVERCRIVITRQYQSIHIINATDCTIAAHFAVSGPVHVTNCHGTTLSTACRQLRIHDCTAVTFRVWVKSGPIIENCSRMVFRGDPVDVRDVVVGDNGGGDGADHSGGVCHWDKAANMYHDVKDFCWLRTGVPSPNFTIVLSGDESVGEGCGTVEKEAVEDVVNSDYSAPTAGQEIINGGADDDADCCSSSSDEDEL